MSLQHTISALPAFHKDDELNVIVETPQGSQNKYNFEPDVGLFELGAAMPSGVTFPFEFGFIPSTLGEDGDPLDLLILMDSCTFVGCLVRCRLIGVIEADQTDEKGKTVRNDRLIGVASKSRRHESIRSISEVPKEVTREIEHFFVSYNQVRGKKFEVRGCHGPKRALRVVEAGVKAAKKQRK